MQIGSNPVDPAHRTGAGLQCKSINAPRMAPVRSSSSSARPARPPKLHSVHYRGFALEQKGDLSWSVQPVGPHGAGAEFTAPPSSLADMRALIDWRLGLPV